MCGFCLGSAVASVVSPSFSSFKNLSKKKQQKKTDWLFAQRPFVHGSASVSDLCDRCVDVFPRLPHSDRCFDMSWINSNLDLLGRTVSCR